MYEWIFDLWTTYVCKLRHECSPNTALITRMSFVLVELFSFQLLNRKIVNSLLIHDLERHNWNCSYPFVFSDSKHIPTDPIPKEPCLPWTRYRLNPYTFQTPLYPLSIVRYQIVPYPHLCFFFIRVLQWLNYFPLPCHFGYQNLSKIIVWFFESLVLL